jgi:sugar lactone lactonase YvrE
MTRTRSHDTYDEAAAPNPRRWQILGPDGVGSKGDIVDECSSTVPPNVWQGVPLRLGQEVVMRIRAVVVPLLVSVLVLSAGLAHASTPAETVVAFDATAGEFPEGVAVDKTGDVYVSLIEPVGDVVRFAPDGSRSVLAHFPAAAFGPLGLATDAAGDVYVADATFDPSTAGIYRVTPGGTATRLPGTGSMQFPNGVALDKRGNIYATDSATGAIWRVPPGGTGEIWLQDPLLQGTGALGLGFPLGANGIAFRKGRILVANTEEARLVSIPVLPNGSPGSPSIVAENPQLFGADGIALSVLGNAFVAVNPQNTLVEVAPDGRITTIATAADGLENPASLAVGARGDQMAVYLTNFAIFASAPHPALLKVDVGEPGVPVP